jgi:PAS domain S-box-containing protein
LDLAPPELRKNRERHFQTVLQTGQTCRFEDENRGTHFDNILYPISQEQGKVTRVALHARDITERKRAEEAYRSLVDHSLQGLAILQDGRVVFANEAMAQITGYTVDEMIAMSAENVRAFVHPEDRDWVWSRYRQRLQGKHPSERYEFRSIRKDGLVRWLEIYACLIEYQGKPAIQAAYRDITHRKNAENELREYQSKLKAMASQLSSIQERQRRQLAVELHDRVTQRLAMVKLGLQTLVGTMTYADAATRIKELADHVGATMEDAYSLMLELSNPVLYEIGLKAAVDTLFQSSLAKNSGIECRLIAPKQPMKIDMNIRIVLYQTIRELVVNAIKYSNAKTIEVHLCRTDDTWTVTVRDDGVGFNPSDVKPPGKEGGFGLFNIRENIGSIGGEFMIESTSGKGTSATACVPLPRK